VTKCSYCDFYSLPSRSDTIEGYVQAVLHEANSFPLSQTGIKGDLQPFQTLYFGGGTPSLLGAKYLRLLTDGLSKSFKIKSIPPTRHSEYNEAISGLGGSPYYSVGSGFEPDRPNGRSPSLSLLESTIEVNPESATREFLEAAKDIGFNRISFGVQSLSDDELKSVGRIHTATQAISAIKLAPKLGFKAISADLIIGLPGQTSASLRKSLEILAGMEIQHLSVYCLSLEDGTPLANNPRADLPSDDIQAKLFEEAGKYLKTRGYLHYEISNFAMKGFECMHNLNYWHGGEYLGLGPAAASHLNGKRFKNYADLDAYLENPAGQIEYIEELSKTEKAAEEAMLRLRLLEEGLNISGLAAKFGEENVKGIRGRLDDMVREKALELDGTTYRLTLSRIMTSNPIFARIISAASE